MKQFARCAIMLGVLSNFGTPATAQTPTLNITPTSGTIGTVVTIQMSPQDPAFAFDDATTTAVWNGVYQPLVGSPTSAFSVSYSAAQVNVTGPYTATLVMGDGAFSNAPDVGLLSEGGTLEGTFTLDTNPACPADLNADGNVDGLDLAVLLAAWDLDCTVVTCAADFDGNGDVDGTDLSFLLSAWGACPVATQLSATYDVVPESGVAEWRFIIYPAGALGSLPAELGPEIDEIALYEIAWDPEPTEITEQQFWAASGYHLAVIVFVEENADTLASAPPTLLADLVSRDASNIEVDRLADLTLTRLANDGDASRIHYVNDISVPILAVDSKAALPSLASFLFVEAVANGSISIEPHD